MATRRVAVLVANSEFPESRGELLALPSTLNDMRQLHELLADPRRGAFTHVQELLDLPSSEVLLRINQVVRTTAREDLLLIYYSGHGKLDRSGALHLAASNTDVGLLPSTSVPVDMLRNLVREAQSRRIIVILDCCYSGAIGSLEPTALLQSTLSGVGAPVTDGYSVFVMTASRPAQQAFTRDGDANGLLTKHVLAGIRSGEADRDKDGVITMDELFAYVRERIEREATQEPLCFCTGSSAGLIIGRTDRALVSPDLLEEIRTRLRQGLERNEIPEYIYKRAVPILGLSEEQIRANYELEITLLRDWIRGELSAEQFVTHWYECGETGLPKAGRRASVSKTDRWETVRECRKSILDLIGPSYVLDRYFHFLDWNPVFDELIARPMGLVRGRHAEDFILKLQNRREVIERSRKAFRAGRRPLVHVEPLEFSSPKYGLIRFQKIAAQIPGPGGKTAAWSVNLNILAAEREDELWDDIEERLRREVNWSKYAQGYDEMLLNFDAYRQLTQQVVALVGDASVVADLASGTGNGAIELVRTNRERRVHAFESNEAMLERLRSKINELEQQQHDRISIFKGDVLVSLREFREPIFDAAIMVNGLYAIDDRARCMREVYRVLKPGGVVALSTPTQDTDVDALFEAIRRNLRRKGKLDTMRGIVDRAYDRHKQMESKILRDSRSAVIDYVKSAGFKVNDIDVIDGAYEGSVVIVKAVKPVYEQRSTDSVHTRDTVAHDDGPRDGATRVFVSYARADEEWCDRLMRYLAPAIQPGVLEVWSDQGLREGDGWHETIQENLARSTAAVLLISQSFLVSKYIENEELPRLLYKAKRDGLIIIPVLLERSLWDEKYYEYRDPDGGRKRFRLSSLHAAFHAKPMDEFDRPQQNIVLDKIADRLLSHRAKRATRPT